MGADAACSNVMLEGFRASIPMLANADVFAESAEFLAEHLIARPKSLHTLAHRLDRPGKVHT